jgi:hypothetical protein
MPKENPESRPNTPPDKIQNTKQTKTTKPFETTNPYNLGTLIKAFKSTKWFNEPNTNTPAQETMQKTPQEQVNPKTEDTIKSPELEIFNPKEQVSKEPFSIGGKFELSSIPENEPVITIKLSGYETAYTYKGHSYIVWGEGPKAGSIYRIIDAPTEEQVASLPKVDEIKQNIIDKLKDANTLRAEDNSLHWDEARLILDNLYVYLHQLYYGDKDTIGLEKAQLFDLEGEGEKYFHFLQKINPPGKGKEEFVKDQRGVLTNPDKILSCNDYLEELAGNNDFSNLFPYSIFINIDTSNRSIYRYFYGESNNDNNKYQDSNDPLHLIHCSYGNILPSVVELGGLAARSHYEKIGIQKRGGGERGGTFSYAPDYVSFWDYSDESLQKYLKGVPMDRNWGNKKGFEHPMVFGISKNHKEGMELKPGTMSLETVVKDFVPFEHISHVFVPGFKVTEVDQILQAHGYGYVNVLSLDKDERAVQLSKKTLPLTPSRTLPPSYFPPSLPTPT